MSFPDQDEPSASSVAAAGAARQGRLRRLLGPRQRRHPGSRPQARWRGRRRPQRPGRHRSVHPGRPGRRTPVAPGPAPASRGAGAGSGAAGGPPLPTGGRPPLTARPARRPPGPAAAGGPRATRRRSAPRPRSRRTGAPAVRPSRRADDRSAHGRPGLGRPTTDSGRGAAIYDDPRAGAPGPGRGRGARSRRPVGAGRGGALPPDRGIRATARPHRRALRRRAPGRSFRDPSASGRGAPSGPTTAGTARSGRVGRPAPLPPGPPDRAGCAGRSRLPGVAGGPADPDHAR